MGGAPWQSKERSIEGRDGGLVRPAPLRRRVLELCLELSLRMASEINDAVRAEGRQPEAQLCERKAPPTQMPLTTRSTETKRKPTRLQILLDWDGTAAHATHASGSVVKLV